LKISMFALTDPALKIFISLRFSESYSELPLWFDETGIPIQLFSSDLFLQPDQRLEAGIYVVCLEWIRGKDLEAIGRVASANPQAKIVLLVSFIESALVSLAFKMGIANVVVGSSDIDYLLAELNTVAIDLVTAAKKARRIASAVAKLELLSPREKDVLDGILDGKMNKQIAADLALSVRTVEMFRASLMQKLEIRTVADAVKLSLIASDDIA
jgi:two-component system response regulator FixJ